MLMWRITGGVATTIVVLAALVVASSPLRFPNSTIVWQPILLLSVPAVSIVALLLIRSRVSHNFFTASILIIGALFTALVLAGYIPWLVFGPAVVALMAMLFASSRFPNADETTTVGPA